MKIYAFCIDVIQNGEHRQGVYMAVSNDGFDAQKKIVKKVEAMTGIKKGSIEFKRKCLMSLEELAKKMGPEVEKLVKETKIKSDLLDVIKKIPIN